MIELISTLTPEQVEKLNIAIHNTPATSRTLVVERKGKVFCRDIYFKPDDDRQDFMTEINVGVVMSLERVMLEGEGNGVRCYFQLSISERRLEFNLSLALCEHKFGLDAHRIIADLLDEGEADRNVTQEDRENSYPGFGDWS